MPLKLQRNYKKITEQYYFLYNLNIFLERGYSINDSMKMLGFYIDIDVFYRLLEEGERFDLVLGKVKFDQDVLLLLKIADESGQLKNGIKNAVYLLKQKIDNKNILLEILKYPILLAVIIIGSMLFISMFLLPQFIDIYQSFGIEFGQLIKLAFLLIQLTPYIVGSAFVFLLVAAFIILRKNSVDKMMFFLGTRLTRKHYLALYNHLFIINLTNLLILGLRLDEVLTILSEQEYNLLLKMETKRILKELNQGVMFSSALNNFYSDELKAVIRDGEQNEMLLTNLENYLLFLNSRKDSKSKNLLFLIQPFFYLVFGIIIVVLYISIFYPMFQMMNKI
ncbi:MAG: type II secretion system F family protein [Mycoplasmatales bacterium]